MTPEVASPWVCIITDEVEKAIQPMCVELIEMSELIQLEPPEKERLRKISTSLNHVASNVGAAVGKVMQTLPTLQKDVVELLHSGNKLAERQR